MIQLLSSMLMIASGSAFAPSSFINSGIQSRTTHGNPAALNALDPSMIIDVTAIPDMVEYASTTIQQSATNTLEGTTSNLLSFSDQGQNLAGIFFQASLLPYLLFLYFLSFRANRISPVGNLGFQFVLLFVASTIPSGIVSKLTYGCSLADVDWLHGGAELLLTVANILIVRFCFFKSFFLFREMCHPESDEIAHLILSVCFCRSMDSKKLPQIQPQLSMNH